MPWERSASLTAENPVLDGQHDLCIETDLRDQRHLGDEPSLSRLDSELLLDGLGDAVVTADDANHIIFLNAAAERLLGWPCEALQGELLSAILPERLRGAHVDALTRYIVSRQPQLMAGRPVRVPALRRDGSEVEVDLTLSAHQLEHGAVLVASMRDLTDRVDLEREQLINRYLEVTRDIALRLGLAPRLESLADAAPLLLDAIGTGLGWDVGVVWERDDHGVLPVAHWARPGLEHAAQDLAGSGEDLDLDGETLPDHVLRTGQPVWIDDFPKMATSRARLAATHGLHTALAFPVTLHSETQGVIEFFFQDRRCAELDLMTAMAATGAQVGQFIERWRAREEVRAAREHLIGLAEAVRASLLPPKLPELPGVDLAAAYHAAAGEGEVGGDFYDVFPLGDETWGIAIGDVCGHGPEAAALTALARHTIRAAASGCRPPVEVLQILNDAVLADNRERDESERFLTVLYFTVRAEGERLTVEIANAGHPLPLQLLDDGKVTAACGPGDLIGVLAEATPAYAALTLGPDGALLAYTDGVIEARVANGRQLTEDGVVKGVQAAGGRRASEIVDRLERVVLPHVTTTTAADDLTIICFRPAPPSSA
jgi:PAS domain S-box-containing protein